MADVRLIPCRADNYAVLVHDRASGATACIDAPEAGPIEAALAAEGWRLTDLLITHGHFDHVEAAPALRARHGCAVVVPAATTTVADPDRRVRGGDIVAVGGLAVEVIDTPGHCADHVAYHLPADRLLFAGDALFAMGCGRVLDGTATELRASLLKLAALPEDTRVYCGHEYTLANARFALTVDPGNEALRLRALEVENLRARGRPTLPTTIGMEKATNPFLRADLPGLARAVGLEGAEPAAVFAALRERKNRF